MTAKQELIKILRERISQYHLASKWAPRKGIVADKLRARRNWSWRFYRKSIVAGTKVVETQMCSKQWNAINFSHVPSIAANRYQKAFGRNAQEAYAAYKAKLVKGDDPKVKVNAGAIFPHEVLNGLKNDAIVASAQWDALTNNVNDGNVIPIVDTSGSMSWVKVGNTKYTPLEVALALGLYCATKNTGKFKDIALTFSDNPRLLSLSGTLSQKYGQMNYGDWGGSTNLAAAFDVLLTTAVKGNVPQDEMPKTLLILSDMQFNQGCNRNDRAIDMIRKKYQAAGYEVPNVVYWNLNAADNVPVTFDEKGTALVSGFNTHIMKAVMDNDLKSFTPENVMLKTIMSKRYDYK